MYILQKYELIEFLKQFDCFSFDDGVGFENGFEDGEVMVVFDVCFVVIFQQEFYIIQIVFQYCYKQNCFFFSFGCVDVCI